MMHYIFIWTRVLFIYCCFLAVHGVQPNCTSVNDFDDCLGNVTGFCPKDIVCACKDGKPFCKCPNFRGQWGNYWYMGAKCDQLWNTLDLVLVAVLPGIGLALIVGVTIQTIQYCQKKSKNNINDQRQQRSSSRLQPEHNSAYAFDNAVRFSQPREGQVNTKIHLSNTLSVQKTPKTEMLCKNTKKLGRLKKYTQRAEGSVIRRWNCTNEEWSMTEDYKKKAEKESPKTEHRLLNNGGVIMSPWSLPRQNGLPTSPVSLQRQFPERDHNFMIHKEGNPYISPSYNLNGSPGTAKPEANYGNKYSSAMHMKPLSNFSTPGLPKSNYIPRERQQIGYPRSEEQEIPYRIGRVQIQSDY